MVNVMRAIALLMFVVVVRAAACQDLGCDIPGCLSISMGRAP